MPTPKKKRSQAPGEGRSNRPREEVVRIHYADDETGPAELLGDGMARILDVPVFTDKFWRDDIVRLAQGPAGQTPRIAGVVSTRFDQHSSVQFFGGESVGTLLLHIFRLLGFDGAVVVPPAEGRPGRISVAHIAGFDPAKVVKLIGADEAERMPPGS